MGQTVELVGAHEDGTSPAAWLASSEARQWMATGAAVLLLAGLGLGRMLARSTSLNRLWAEDGKVFLGAAWKHPITTTLLQSYQGYLHVLPRRPQHIA